MQVSYEDLTDEVGCFPNNIKSIYSRDHQILNIAPC